MRVGVSVIFCDLLCLKNNLLIKMLLGVRNSAVFAELIRTA